jgi:hypothetical protein
MSSCEDHAAHKTDFTRMQAAAHDCVRRVRMMHLNM